MILSLPNTASFDFVFPMSSLDGNHIFQVNALLKDFLYEKITNPEQPAQKKWNQK